MHIQSLFPSVTSVPMRTIISVDILMLVSEGHYDNSKDNQELVDCECCINIQ